MHQRTLRRSAPLALALALAAGCGERREPAAATGGADRPVDGGVAVVCSPAAPERLAPFLTPDQLSADLRQILYTPLVRYDSAGGFAPYLATDWSWSDDRRTLLLHLRRDVRWHDGRPVTAQDVAFTLRRAADAAFGYWSQSDFATLSSATAKDSATVEVRFEAPYVAGLEPFANLPVLPEHLLGSLSAEAFRDADYHRSPVGSGPFRFAGRGQDGSVTFSRFDAFPAALGRPHLDRIVLRVVREPSVAVLEMRSGTIDFCIEGSSAASQLQAAGPLRALPVDPRGVTGIPLNTRDAPLRDVRVRQALSAALRRADVATVISPLARPTSSFFPSASPYADTTIAQPDADSALAVSLLRQAGWSEIGADGLRRDAAGRPLRFTILAPRAMEAALTVVQQQLERVGITADLRFMEWTAYLSTIRDPKTRPAAMALSYYPDKVIEPDYYDNFASDGGSNFSDYSSPAVDTLLARLRSTLGHADRRRLYDALQRRVAGDVPVLYIASVPRLAIVGPRLHGVSTDLNGPFASVADWWVSARR